MNGSNSEFFSISSSGPSIVMRTVGTSAHAPDHRPRAVPRLSRYVELLVDTGVLLTPRFSSHCYTSGNNLL